MKKYLLLAFCVLLFSSCQSQSTEKKLEKNEAINPKTNIIVHKEYDDQGNLIRIDSSYSYVYSNIKNDSILEKQLFNNFKLKFNNHDALDSIFKNNFFNDKMLKMNDLYIDDFFEKHMKQQIKEMQKTMKKFDSLKNNFYKNQFLLENDKKSELKQNKKL